MAAPGDVRASVPTLADRAPAPHLEPRRQRLFHHAEEQARDLGIPLRHVEQLTWALALQGGL